MQISLIACAGATLLSAHIVALVKFYYTEFKEKKTMNEYGIIRFAGIITGLQLNFCTNRNMCLISILLSIHTVSEHFNTSFQMYGHIIAA